MGEGVSEQKVKLAFPIITPCNFSSRMYPSPLEHTTPLPLWAWYGHSLDKHSSTMRSQKCSLFLCLSSQIKPQKMPLVCDRSWEFVFNLELSHEHAGFSPKIGSTECRWGGKRRVRGRRWRGGKEEGRGLWLMSTRCLTFGGNHILWSFSWCVICAWTYVRRDARAPFTCRGSGKKNTMAGTQHRNFRPSTLQSWIIGFRLFLWEKTHILKSEIRWSCNLMKR